MQKLSRVELAVLNNTRWYEAIFDAHELASEVDGRVWLSRQTPPPFHSNLVVLSPTTSQSDIEVHVAKLGKLPLPKGWSLKDSYACLDLSSLGFARLFTAEWIWRDPLHTAPRGETSRLAWTRVSGAAELAKWEAAWAGDARNDSAARMKRQFPERLLNNPDFAFFAGRLDGRIIAGGVANNSPEVVGLSNVFSPQAFSQEAWSSLVTCLSSAFPDMPLVGYERDADLMQAKGVGFEPIGALRVWWQVT
jgi:hypothetical protein